MFGMGGSEIIVILIIALLFLGPDKLPQAAKSISKGIRDIKKQSKSLQQQIESDEQFGGAIRDLKSALRGEDEPRVWKPRVKRDLPEPGNTIHVEAGQPEIDVPALPDGSEPAPEAPAVPAEPRITLPATAGEPDGDEVADAGDVAGLVKPATGTVPKSKA
jgi:sec-independent protein translocase protein TatB